MENAVRDCGNGNDNDQDLVVLTQALKEWAIAVSSLRSGALIMLLRKGGIRDPLHPFANVPKRAALFPTYEHQAFHYFQHPVEVTQPDPNAPILIDTWAEITHGFTLQTEAEVMALESFHIWKADFIAERLKWRSQQPLHILLLRAYALPQAVELVRSPSHGGCRSWIDLDTPIAANLTNPVLSTQAYQVQLHEIENAVRAIQPDFRLSAWEWS